MLRVIICVAMLSITSSFEVLADDFVPGYMRSDGTYVPPHWRTSPNSTKIDNYSTRGNVNPYTGERGSVDPFAPQRPSTAIQTNPYDDLLRPSQAVKPSTPGNSRRKSILDD